MIANVIWPLADMMSAYIYSLGKYLRARHVPGTNLNKAVVAFKVFSSPQLTVRNAYTLVLNAYKCSDNVS